MSKFIKKNRFSKGSATSNYWSGIWANSPKPSNNNSESNHYRIVKDRIENTPLEELDYTHLYVLPLKMSIAPSSWVYDFKGNFVFQFERAIPVEDRQKILDFLNGDSNVIIKHTLKASNDGVIYAHDSKTSQNIPIITIRGWGNLTGVGAHNLSPEYASKIQDTFQDFIFNKLNKDEEDV